MPPISQRLTAGVPNGYTPVEPQTQPTPQSGPAMDQGPAPNMFVRTPMPPVWSTNPDSARQFYRNGKIPQFKIWTRSLNGQ